MRKFLRRVAACGALLVFSSAQAVDIKPRQFTFAFTQPLDSSHGAGAQHFADLLAKKSAAKLKVKIFGGGVLGGEAQVLSALRGGTIDISVMAPSLLVGTIKEYAIWDLPFLIQTSAEADSAMDGPVGQGLLAKLPERGMIGLTYWEHGFRNLTNNKRAVAKLEDIDGLKIRVLQNPLYVDVFKALGANAVPLPFPELYGAMESRAVDGQEQPYASILANKFNEVQKHLSITRHIYNPLLVLVSKKAWDQLSAEQQQMLRQAAVETSAYQRGVARDLDAKALIELKSKGMAVTEVSAKELDRMRERIAAATAPYTREIGEPLVQLQEQLRKLRAGK